MKYAKAFSQKQKKVNSEEWFEIGKKALAKVKHEFGLIYKMRQFFQKGEKKDSEREVCRELIQRFDQKRLSMQEAQQLALLATNNLQGLQKKLPNMLLYLLGGGLLTVIAIVFMVIRLPVALAENSSQIGFNLNLIFILVQFFISLAVLIIGMRKRQELELSMLLNGVLAQASAAFAGSRAPGKGGTAFEAFFLLDQLRDKNKKAFQEKYGSVFKLGK